jgi:hypothetical protein
VNALLIFGASIGSALVAVGFYNLQLRLEQWDHNRHAED